MSAIPATPAAEPRPAAASPGADCPARLDVGEVVICCTRTDVHDMHRNQHHQRMWTDDDPDSIADGPVSAGAPEADPHAWMDEPVDSESPDAQHNPDVFEMRSRIRKLRGLVAARDTQIANLAADRDRLASQLDYATAQVDRARETAHRLDREAAARDAEVRQLQQEIRDVHAHTVDGVEALEAQHDACASAAYEAGKAGQPFEHKTSDLAEEVRQLRNQLAHVLKALEAEINEGTDFPALIAEIHRRAEGGDRE